MKDSKISHAGKPAGAPLQLQRSPPYRILVVEDDEYIRKLSAMVLIRVGYQVDVAQDGEAGWEALHTKNYDLLITDNNMPMFTGVDLIKKLRSEDTTLPVIMATGAIPTEELNREPGLQPAAMLLKPFTIEELLGTVARVLRAADSARRNAEIYIPAMTGAVGQNGTFAQGHR